MVNAMRVLLGIAAIVVVAAVSGASGAATSTTALSIAFWDDGQGAGDRATWSVRCDPARGTLQTRVSACRALTRSGARELFRGTPKNMACTDIYGGPEVAIVTGMIQGQRLWARFSRTNGCEIERWERLQFMLPAGGA
jgi:hypothetical protein